ncbi:MAG: glyoxalase [SAR86 cluster bacterium]|uniref:Glyoxalase n=1 Tax=SAR86 cluster bacterium TaxID=2030880 RepID=A0A2A5B7R1_9GAMM|nr:MAG: glyoxalase [SAR86 cluster bacterium]
MAINRVSHITIYVTDQDQALRWYQDKLGFEVCMDNDVVVSGMRWLTVCPVGNQSTQFTLVLAISEEDKTRVGTNLMTVLSTDDCIGDMARLARLEVEIVGPPEEVPWGISGIIRDLYGNPYNLVGPG